MARIFLAIDLPEKVQSNLEKQLEPIKKLYPQFSWVPQENYHITIYYFGQVENPEEIDKRLKDLIYDQPKFYFYSTNIDLFISKKIMIYLNFRREKNLEQLVELLRDNFLDDPQTDRKFLPHIALSRYKIPSKQQYLALKKRLGRISIDVEFIASKITLFESITSGKAPVYKKIAQYKLG